MLPTTLVTIIISFILKTTSSSPVYNLQPAYITATIGSTGRNIRNLPCISRRTNQNGVCMFAIDCLKANGTHLGTCIDRFYFGSCCHVESTNDIIENTIDAALVPSREPPNRLATTASINTTNPSISNITTTIKPTTKTKEEKPTTAYKLTTSQKLEEELTTIKTKPFPTKPHKPIIKISTTTKKPIITTVKRKLSQKPITTNKPTKITTESSINTTKPSIPVNTTKAADDNSTNLFDLNTLPLNNTPVTFSVAGNPATNEIEQQKPLTTEITIQKPPKPTTTNKPFLEISKLPSSTKLPPNIFPTKISIIENMTKPTKITIPPTKFTFFNFTRPLKPSTAQDTKVTIITNNPTLFTQTTNSPFFSQSTKEAVISTTNKISITDTMKPTTEDFSTRPDFTTGSDSSSPFTAEYVQTTPGNPSTGARPIGITLMPAATRPTEKDPNLETTFPAFVTWSQIVENTGSTTVANTNATEDNTVTEEWLPMSTPDGWVLLPSLTTITDFAIPNITTTKPTTFKLPSSTSEEIEISSESPFFSTLIQSTENTVVTTSGTLDKTSTSSISNISTSRPVDSSHNPVNMSDFTDVCGRRMFPEARIVGGEKSSFGRWPWQISLRQWRTSTYLHKCGAALLNENWAVTAAHCVDNVPPSDLLLRLGEHDLSTESEPYLHQERRVQIVASHPQFDPRTFEYDLALLRFYEPVQFQPNIIPVCVPQNDENFVGRTAYVTGWGRLYEDGPLPSILQEVSVPVINNTVCESMYRSAGYIEHIPNIFICAGWRRGGFDSCEGDSGGPMVIQRPDKRFLLAGVISWGIGCAEPNQPGVYTRISEFRDWINQILQF